MRVQLQTSGGIAYFPGLSKPIIVDSSELSNQESSRLRRMLKSARFFSLPPVIHTAKPGAADYHQYTITVKDGNRSHTINFTDPVENPSLQELLNYLRTQQTTPS